MFSVSTGWTLLQLAGSSQDGRGGAWETDWPGAAARASKAAAMRRGRRNGGAPLCRARPGGKDGLVDRDLPQQLEIGEHLAGAEDDGRQGVVGDGDGEAR